MHPSEYQADLGMSHPQGTCCVLHATLETYVSELLNQYTPHTHKEGGNSLRLNSRTLSFPQLKSLWQLANVVDLSVQGKMRFDHPEVRLFGWVGQGCVASNNPNNVLTNILVQTTCSVVGKLPAKITPTPRPPAIDTTLSKFPASGS